MFMAKMKKFVNSLIKSIKYSFSSSKPVSRYAKIAQVSLVTFALGVVITTVSITSFNSAKQRTAKGGFETPAVPDFTEDVLVAADVDNEELLIAQELALDEGEVAQLQDLPEDTKQDSLFLTYQTYRVKSGDMIGFIADRYGVTQDTIISINNIKQSRLIQVGQYLKIPSMPGILYSTKAKGETPQTISEKYKVDAEKCALVNSISVDTELENGVTIFIPDAQLDWATRQEINGDLFRRPLRAKYYLSSYYGWRDSPFNTGKRSFHTGIDMACPTGTPIYPAMDGLVTAAGYNSTYGNYVIIQHHSGYKTLYGHMSKITCKKGNFVYTTTQIGKVGSTGLSTGPHLHFTVYKNGKTVNPLGLLN